MAKGRFRAALLLTLVVGAHPLFGAISSPGAIPSASDYDVYRGSVSFKNFGDHMIGILVIDERGRDSGYVHLFRLWTESTLNSVNVSAANASVEFRDRELVILIPEQQLFYTFVVADAEYSAPKPPTGFTSARYVGYGLNHEIRANYPVNRSIGGRKVKPADICADPSVDCILYPADDPGGGGAGGSGCDAGGPGANSCSITNSAGNCSVGCSWGYYACCVRRDNTSYCFCNHN